ncbi:MAG: PstS family phosphate ABC transporter substrate-binding protein [Magnetococcales bacterium]|nr:PstS family phosphate ABC transporter substrate-binding protein [Magnetococcales bacterium]
MKKLVFTILMAAGLSSIPFAANARVMLQNKGSDTLVNVAQAWAEEYQTVKPKIAVAVTGGGSGTGIAALLNGAVDIANASRKIKSKELKMAAKRGIKPVEHVVGYDALAVYVHKNNPMKQIAIPTLAEIYGEDGATTKWTDINLKIPGCRGQQMVLISRQNNSGTYAYFRKAVLGKKRDFKLGTRDLHGSKDVVDLVEHTPCAIGYSGLAYATDHVKMACIAKTKGGPCVNPSVASASDNSYPIARPLMMYTNGAPTGHVKDYLDWIMSDEGQCIILKKGYAPIRAVNCK